MEILHTDFNKNPNLGLYAYATEEYCLVGKEVPDELCEELGKVLNVPIHRIQLCGTSLVGVFCAGNSKTLLLPAMCFEDELEELNELGITYELIETELTALGNNILCNDHGAYINPDFGEKESKQIAKALGVEVKQGQIGDVDVTGATCIVLGDCGLVSPYVEADQLVVLEDLLKVSLSKGTVNFGSPYVKSAVIANKNGFAAGKLSTGVELDQIHKALGYNDE